MTAATDYISPDANARTSEGSAELVRRSLTRRRMAEHRFRLWGMAAVAVGIALVLILFGSILSKGLPAFWQAAIHVDVFFDPAVIKAPERPVQEAGESDAEFQKRDRAWQTKLTLANWGKLIDTAIIAKAPEAGDVKGLKSLYASGERYRLRDMVVADPSLIGTTVPLSLLADADIDVWLKGNIDRSLPDSQQQLSPGIRNLADRMYADGVISMDFASTLFTNTDSRSSPASAGLAGALVGSLYMMLVVIFLAVPIGVLSALYLEEFAPKNRFTDVIEVNINNLAAVPSIVFGLLGAAVFINWLHLPLSAPFVGGLVLTLMTLPTIIIATRSTLRAVPPSIRQAALGIGASPVQTVFHHILPVAVPGILTATIIGVAQALGETAPLLLIGMSAFVANVPATPFDQSTALPVQIYLWQGNEARNFFEARTSAAIIVLLGLMIILNAIAIFLRQRFERRW